MPHLSATTLSLFLFFTLPISLVALHANRLADSQSPYLLQHADNPVDWYPWGNDAFAAAETQNKLVLVSIGYSTCHWCHVMNRESFSDPEIAAYLNANYICIKVDREERPDIDSTYMTFVQSLHGTAGWPLNVILTPDRKPIYGGTYFPPRTSPTAGQGFLELVQEIQSSWQSDPDSLRNRSHQYAEALRAKQQPTASDASVSTDLISTAITSYFFQFDSTHGGFDKGEKFPNATILSFLLQSSVQANLHPEDRDLAKSMALQTLDAIAASGLRDHLGGGLHRYTVDPEWKLPHFEKMLYDQALLAQAFTQAWQLTKNDDYRDAACDTLDYLLRDMRHPAGAFYSAEDAESLAPEDPTKKREGAFYLWTEQEIRTLLPDPKLQQIALQHYAVTANGNLPSEAFPSLNTLRRETPLTTTDFPKAELATIDQTLLAARNKRPRPHRDDKIVTAWNALAISAFAQAANAFDRQDYARAATDAANFLLTSLYDSNTKTLVRTYRDQASETEAFAEDYAFFVAACLDLYEATADHAWIQKADTLQSAQIEKFYDSAHGGFFLFAADNTPLSLAQKRSTDSALPNANAVSTQNLLRLSQYFDNADYLAKAKASIACLLPALEETPTALPSLLSAGQRVAQKPLQIVIAGNPTAPDVQTMLRLVHDRLLPNHVLLYADQANGQTYLGQHLEFIEFATAYDGKATAYVCENYVCQLPTDDPQTLAAQLDARLPQSPKLSSPK